MMKLKAALPIIASGIFLISLTGCEQVEQAANEALQQAEQSAVQVLDEAMQTGSIDEARQTANDTLHETRQKAARLLDQASKYLTADPQGEIVENLPEEALPSAI